MQKTYPIVRCKQSGKTFRNVRNCSGIEIFIAIHCRTDHIKLPAFCQQLLHIAQHGTEAVLLNQLRNDRLSAWRHRLDRADCHIPIQHGRQGPWNRRCTHQQEIHPGSFLSQGPALFNPEALLLIRNDKSELLKGNLLLQKTMRADQDIDGTICCILQNLFLLSRFQSAVQHADLHPVRRKQLIQGRSMLAGKDFRRSKQRSLKSCRHRSVQRKAGNQRLAASDIALNKPVHQMIAFQISQDLLQRFLLIRSHRKRKTGDDFLQLFMIHMLRLLIGIGAVLILHELHCREEMQKLRIFERPVGCLHFRHGLWFMNHAQRQISSEQPVCPLILQRHIVFNRPRC